MTPTLTQCPACTAELEVRRLECRRCGTAVEGRFSTGPLGMLPPDQLAFIETFVLCEGKFTRMEGELGLSYPTLRARLHDIIRALGHEPGTDDAQTAAAGEVARRDILDRLDRGELTPDQAVRLLRGDTEGDKE